ncbi:EutN/CcmL family microcompartment protein [bacterium]|nr:EutN/CcmL family microcompartment protein [candidate division CSSED10-310 bacterium]
MKLGNVIGNVWAERKVKQLHGCRLLVVQPIQSSGRPCGSPLVVADPGRLAGIGDTVVIVTSTDAAQAFDSGVAPVNAAVVELVDIIQ